MAEVNPGIVDLKTWWALNEVSGNALDSHGSNDMTDNGTVDSVVDGTLGRVRDFERTIPEFFSINDDADISMGDTEWTIGAFLYVNENTGINDFIDKYSATNGMLSYFSSDNDNMLFAVYGGGSVGEVETANSSIAQTTWYMITMYHSATANEIGISINGGAYTTQATSGAVVNGAALGFGSRVTGSPNTFTGRMSRGFKFDKVLTTDEALWLYNSGNGRSYAEIVGSPPSIKTINGIANWKTFCGIAKSDLSSIQGLT